MKTFKVRQDVVLFWISLYASTLQFFEALHNSRGFAIT